MSGFMPVQLIIKKLMSHLPFSCGPCSTNQVYQVINVIVQILLTSLQVSQLLGCYIQLFLQGLLIDLQTIINE